jgi:hypothetical protein
MKRKDIVFFTLITLIVFLVGAYLTFSIYSNERLVDVFLGDPARNKVLVTEAAKCTTKEVLPGLSTSPVDELKALGDYQDTCNSYVTNTTMMFVGMQWINNPIGEADKIVAALSEYKKVGVKPLIIMEPYLDNSSLVDWKSFTEATPLTQLTQYFDRIKSAGITDSDMGTLVPFPEPNVPNWGPKNGDGELFVKSINIVLGQYKKAFPTAKGSILLNSQTYPADDTNWENGDYIPFSYYLTGLTPGIVDVLGIQGFPWVSTADAPRKRELYEAKEFLAPDLTIAAMKTLRVRDVWFNTGTFGHKYANDDNKKVVVPAADRKKIVVSIFDVTESLIQSGYRVSVNLFSADKTKVRESTDWSYLKSTEYQVVFRDIVREAQRRDVPISMATL